MKKSGVDSSLGYLSISQIEARAKGRGFEILVKWWVVEEREKRPKIAASLRRESVDMKGRSGPFDIQRVERASKRSGAIQSATLLGRACRLAAQGCAGQRHDCWTRPGVAILNKLSDKSLAEQWDLLMHSSKQQWAERAREDTRRSDCDAESKAMLSTTSQPGQVG